MTVVSKSFLSGKIKFPEIFVGLVSPVGTDIKVVIDSLKQSFEKHGYDVSHIKLSSIMKEFERFLPPLKLKETPRTDRVNSYIDFGNEMRRRLGNDILGALAIAKINEARFAKGPNHGFAKRVFLIDQLKTEDELGLLRQVYGRGFFQMSVYSARDIRVDNLSRQTAHDNLSAEKNRFRNEAEALVTRDEDERGKPHGQKVGRIFQLADVVVNADIIGEPGAVPAQVDRFVDLLFGANSYSPNRMEYGMYLAYSAALRSLDLSRQVGAAIFLETGEIATLGSNEVPHGGGGTYWADDPHDAREYKIRHDSNDMRKKELLNEVLEIVVGKDGVVDDEKMNRLRESQFMDALEYGRIIHAEMSAISDAARLGIPIGGGTLYCTTFPCHVCAKHIVASGIKKVVFLEPYPKSLTADLHSDSVKIEGSSRGVYDAFPSAEFAPFHGITPRRYRDIFIRQKRKEDGKFQEYAGGEPQPIFTIIIPWYASREYEILTRVKDLPLYLLSEGRRRVRIRRPVPPKRATLVRRRKA